MRPVARSVFSLLALGALAVVTPAAAEDSQTVTAVYFGAEDSAENAGAVAAILSLWDPPVQPGAPPVHLDRHFAPGQLHVLGAGASRCTGGPVDLGTYQALLDDLDRASWAMEDTATIHRTLLAAQPCLTAPATAELLARVHFLEGVNRFDPEDPDAQDAARDAFHLVHAIDPSYPWDDSYPPNAQMCFADAKLQVLGEQKVPIRLFVPVQAAVWLDGTQLDPAGGDPETFPGRHLVQFQEAAGAPLRSISIQVEPDAQVTIFDPKALSHADQADQDAITTALLRHLASIVDAGVPDYVVALSPEVTVWRWNGETDALERIETPASAAAHLPGRRPTPRRAAVTAQGAPSPAVPILIGAGAGMMVVGAILTAVTAQEYESIWDGYTGESATLEEYNQVLADFQQRREQSDVESWNRQAGVGIGLMAGGGIALVASIPVGTATARGRDDATISAALRLIPSEGPDEDSAPGLGGASLTVGIRWPR